MERRVICIVNGDDAVRASMQFMLEAYGWTVLTFRSSAEFLQSWAPSCLIVDQDLPDMAGLQLIAEIRRRGLTTLAVLTSNGANPEIRERAEAQGTLLVDPLEPNHLISVVRAALEANSGSDGSSDT